MLFLLIICILNAIFDLSKGKPLDRVPLYGPTKLRETVSHFYLQFKMGKSLNVFCDESGDTGFEGKASKFYIVSLVFHDQSNDISSQISKFKNEPVFHVGPIIRREKENHNLSISERRILLNKILMFYTITPILHKEFVYKKREFEGDNDKLLIKLTKDISQFLLEHFDYFSSFKVINIYYDKGQQIVNKALIKSFGYLPLNVVFKKNVKNENYRLAQVADYITSIYLTHLNILNGLLSKSEELFFSNKSIFKRLYFKTLRKKEFK